MNNGAKQIIINKVNNYERLAKAAFDNSDLAEYHNIKAVGDAYIMGLRDAGFGLVYGNNWEVVDVVER